MEEERTIQRIDEFTFTPFAQDNEIIRECVMPILVVVGDAVVPVGTGFIIRPDGLFMTATHVLEYAASLTVSTQHPDGSTYPHHGIHALHVGRGTTGGLMRIDKVWSDPSHDVSVAFLRVPVHVETGKMLQLWTTRLQARPPNVGDHIVAAGYHSMAAGRIVSNTLDYSQESALSSATVLEVFDTQRDRVAANFPCFHVSARFDPGMSGGPIFGPNGCVVGLVCRGMLHDLSLGASLWPALALEIQFDDVDHPTTLSLLEAARRAIVDVADIDAVSMEEGMIHLATDP